MFELFLAKAFLVVLVLSGVPLIAGSLSGLCVAILQAATQVQEQSIAFLVKFCAISVVLVVGYVFGREALIEMLRSYFANIETLGRM